MVIADIGDQQLLAPRVEMKAGVCSVRIGKFRCDNANNAYAEMTSSGLKLSSDTFDDLAKHVTAIQQMLKMLKNGKANRNGRSFRVGNDDDSVPAARNGDTEDDGDNQ